MPTATKKEPIWRPPHKQNLTISPTLKKEAYDFLTETFKSKHSGAQYLLDSYPSLFRSSLREIKGKFSKGELCMILDVLNGFDILLTSGDTAGQTLPITIPDHLSYHPGIYEAKWDISDADDFVARLKSCTRFQLVCLEIWGAAFWLRSEYYDLNEYVRLLL